MAGSSSHKALRHINSLLASRLIPDQNPSGDFWDESSFMGCQKTRAVQYPHHNPQIGILSSLLLLFHEHNSLKTAISTSSNSTGLGCPPECGQIKERNLPQTHNFPSRWQSQLGTDPRWVSEEFPFAPRLQFLDSNCWNPFLIPNPALPGPCLTPAHHSTQSSRELEPWAMSCPSKLDLSQGF